jgi:hypothetical protein
MMHPRNAGQRPSSFSWLALATFNSYTARDDEDLSGLQTSAGDLTSPHRTAKHGRPKKRCSFAISQPFALIMLCLLLPSAALLGLIMYYRVGSDRCLFTNTENAMNKNMLYVNMSATILTNVSSVSSTLAPFLIGLIMAIWSPYVARTLVKASQEPTGTCQRLPTPFQFSLLATMRAGRLDQIWKYISHSFEAYRRQTPEIRPPILQQTAIILFLSLFVTFLTFLGDQFFHLWSKSVVLDRYNVPDSFNSFGRGLTHRCITIDRSNNFGDPCTRGDNFAIGNQQYSERENDVSYIQANTSQLNQIQFLGAASLPRGDLAVLYPAASAIPSRIDYRGSTLGVSTQCQLMTPICRIKHLSNILTQFNCTETFFGVLGKPANITYNMFSKGLDPDVPGLAWKISPSLEYAFYSDDKLRVPYNTQGYDPITGNMSPNLPTMPDSKLVNPVYLAVAGRITNGDMAFNSTLAAKSPVPLFLPTYGGAIFDFFLNCSYTTYDVEYIIVNGTTQSDFSFKPTPNGSVAEEWHGRQQYVSLNGDPSNGLVENQFTAAKQPTPADFARTWANLYSVRVLSVIGAYTNPKLNIQEQVRSQLLVTRVVPWTLGFLLAANFTYVLLGMVVGAIARAVLTKEVLEVSEMMDLNKLITERYGGVEMSGGNDYQRASTAQMTSQRDPDSGFRVGVIKAKFESLYFAA